jgi:hypothetical protein
MKDPKYVHHSPPLQFLNDIPPDSILNKYCKPYHNNPPGYKSKTGFPRQSRAKDILNTGADSKDLFV